MFTRNTNKALFIYLHAALRSASFSFFVPSFFVGMFDEIVLSSYESTLQKGSASVCPGKEKKTCKGKEHTQ